MADISRTSISVDPDFDQEALFRQFEAAVKRLPDVTLRPRLLARDVNQQVAKLNAGKLSNLSLGITITTVAANKAIREVSAKKLVPLSVDVKFSRAQIQRALREQSTGLTIGGGNNARTIVSEDQKVANQRKIIYDRLGKDLTTISARSQAKILETENVYTKKSELQQDAHTKRLETIYEGLGRRLVEIEASTAAKKQAIDDTLAARQATEALKQSHRLELIAERSRLAIEAQTRKPIIQNIILNTKGLSNSLRGFEFAAQKALRGGGLAVAAFGIATTAAVTAITAASIKSFADLQKNAKNAGIIFAQLEPGFNRITNSAKRFQVVNDETTKSINASRLVSLKTTFTANQLSQGLFFLASAGVKSKDALQQLGGIAQFAQAGLFDVQTASELLLQSANATGEGIGNLKKIEDELTLANDKSATSLLALSQALTNRAGAAFKSLHEPVEQTIGLLQEFGNVGVVGKDAGTQLAIIIRDLNAAASGKKDTNIRKYSQAFKDLGIQVFNADGSLKPFAATLDTLADKIGGLNAKQQTLVLGDLGFQQRSSQGLIRLLVRAQQLHQQGSSLQDQVNQLGRESTGAVGKAAQEQLQTVSAQFAIFRNNIVALAQVFAEPVAKALSAIITPLGKTEGIFDLLQGTAKALGKELAGNLVKAIKSVTASDIKVFFKDLLVAVELVLTGVKLFFTTFAAQLDHAGKKVSVLQSIGILAKDLGKAFAVLAPIVGEVLGKLVNFVTQHPELTKFFIEATIAGLAFSKILRVIIVPLIAVGEVIGTFIIEAGGIIGIFGAIGEAVVTTGFVIAGFGIIIAELPFTPFIAAIGGVALAFVLAYNNSKFFRDACNVVSSSVLSTIPYLDKGLKKLSQYILALEGVKGAAEGVGLTQKTQDFIAFKNQHPELGPKQLTAAYRSLNKQIIGSTNLNKQLFEQQKKTNAGTKPAVHISAAAKALAAANAEVKKQTDASSAAVEKLLESLSGNGKGKGKGKGTGDGGGATPPDKFANAIKIASSAVNNFQAQLKPVSDELDKQKGLVDKLASSLEALKNVNIKGTGAFEDQKFAIDQQSKALQLQQTNLELAGATSDSAQVKALQDQIDKLNLQSQQVDLTESLQIDPLKRQLDQKFSPTKELPFDQIVAQFDAITKKHTTEQKTLDGLQRQYDALNGALTKRQSILDKLQSQQEAFAATATTKGSALKTATAIPDTIGKPLQAANSQLQVSNTALSKSLAQARELIRKPFRLATQDIANYLSNLPATSQKALSTALAWADSTGEALGAELIGGFITGMRSFLAPKTELYNLLHIEIPEFIRANKGPVSYDRTILVPAGVAVMEGLTTGLRRGFEPVKGFLKDVGPSLEEFVPDSVFGKKTAEFLVEVAAGKKPDPNKFFSEFTNGAGALSVPLDLGGAINDPRLSFLHKTLSIADTAAMARDLAKTFGMQITALGPPSLSAPLGLPGHNTFVAGTGNVSDHTKGYAADLSNGVLTPQEDRLAAALKPLFGTIFKQLIYRNHDLNRGFFVPNHENHVHVAWLPAPGFSIGSGKIGKPSLLAGGKGFGAQTPFEAIIEAASRLFHVPAGLIKAISKAESGFDPNVVSPAGAAGVMQLLPSTFAGLHVGSNIFDPKQNIFAGTKYLKSLLNHFHSPALAAAGYNAGGANVERFGGIPPFAETIAYVKKVLEYLKDFGGFRANGGRTMANTMYMTGERGPEPFMADRPGFVMSNEKMNRMLSAADNPSNGPVYAPTYKIQGVSADEVIRKIDARERRRLQRLS